MLAVGSGRLADFKRAPPLNAHCRAVVERTTILCLSHLLCDMIIRGFKMPFIVPVLLLLTCDLAARATIIKPARPLDAQAVPSAMEDGASDHHHVAATYPPASPRAGQRVNPIFVADVSAPDMVEAAKWAVHELMQMSDSGVFETLQLKTITFAAHHVGLYHNNTLLRLGLASPHLQDPSGVSEHEVVVMTPLDPPHTRSFSIDDFPLMTDDAVESFWRAKAERQSAIQEEAFAFLEQQAAADCVAGRDNAEA
jgi:hypothetical protein